MKVIIIISLISLAITLGSCCQDDKVCPGANSATYPAFPYTIGEKLTYKDSLQRIITVKIDNQITPSLGWTQNGPCTGSFRELEDCASSIILNGTVEGFDSFTNSGLPFEVKLNRLEEGSNNPVNYALRGLSSVNINIGNYELATPTPSGNFLTDYSTPFKSYQNVYWASAAFKSSRKYVWTSKGRLISFSINGDTLNLFHLVE